MISIEKILGNEQYDAFIAKLNNNFTQIAQLNGGPRGPVGKQVIPGLPGAQGRQGFKADPAKDGNRVFLIGSAHGPSILPTGPGQKGGPDDIYVVGDVFVDGNVMYKIVEIIYDDEINNIDNEYVYDETNFAPTSIAGDSWITSPAINDTVISTFLKMQIGENVDPLTISQLLTRNVNIDLSEDPDVFLNTTYASVGNPISVFSKKQFKLTLHQVTAATPNESFYSVSSFDNRLPSMNYFMFGKDINYGNISIADVGTPTKFNSQLSAYDYIKSFSPILYIQSSNVNDSGNITDNANLSNFGIGIQKIIGLTPETSYSTLVVSPSTSKTNTSIYLRVKNVWSDGGFVSEVNISHNYAASTEYNGKYTSIVTPTTLYVTTNNQSAVIAKNTYGHSAYTREDENSSILTKFMTGIETSVIENRTNPSVINHNGIMSFYIGNSINSINGINTNALTTRSQVLKIDEFGNFGFINSKQQGGEIGDIANLTGYLSNYIFKSNYYHEGNYPVLSGRSIVKIIYDGSNYFMYGYAKSDNSHNLSGLYDTKVVGESFTERVLYGASTDLYGYRLNERMIGKISSTERIRGRKYTSVDIAPVRGALTATSNEGYTWGITEALTDYMHAYDNNIMGIDYNIGGATRNSNAFVWIAKKYVASDINGNLVNTRNDASTYNTLSDKRTVDNEVGLVLHKARFQMFVDDTLQGTTESTNVLGRILTSKSNDGVAKWSTAQSVIGASEIIDLFTTVSNYTLNSKVLKHIAFLNNTTGDWSNYIYADTVNLIIPTVTTDDEHEIIFKATNKFLRASGAMKIYEGSLSGTVLYTLSDKDKDLLAKGAVISIKLKSISAKTYSISGSTVTPSVNETRAWSLLSVTNTLQSGSSVNDITWGNSNEIKIN